MRHHRKQCRPTTILMQAWPLSIPPKIGSKAGVFLNVSSNPRLHADRPVGTCNRRWRQPLNLIPGSRFWLSKYGCRVFRVIKY